MWTNSDYAITALFGVWSLCSILRQFPTRWAKRVQRWDVLRLAPPWKFFIHNVLDCDFHLFYRDLLPDGSVTKWHRGICQYRKTLLLSLWNPERRIQRSLIDDSEDLIAARSNPKVAARGKVADRSLRAHIHAWGAPPSQGLRQYAVMKSKCFEDERLELVVESVFYADAPSVPDETATDVKKW